MRPAKPDPIRLGTGHCCVCAVTCNHIGPVRLCRTHWLDGKAVRFPDDPLVPDRRDGEGITLKDYLEADQPRDRGATDSLSCPPCGHPSG